MPAEKAPAPKPSATRPRPSAGTAALGSSVRFVPAAEVSVPGKAPGSEILQKPLQPGPVKEQEKSRSPPPARRRGTGAASGNCPEELKDLGGFEWGRFGPPQPGATCGRLPEWERESLHQNLAPNSWEPPIEWFHQVKDGVETKPHRLDVWLAKFFDLSSTHRKQAADTLKNAPEGAWVRVPHRIATLENGQVHHSNMVPPFRLRKPYGAITTKPGPDALPQVVGFHGTSLDYEGWGRSRPASTQTRGGVPRHVLRSKLSVRGGVRGRSSG